MEVASSDDVGFVEVLDRFGRGLDVQLSFFLLRRKDLQLEHSQGKLRVSLLSETIHYKGCYIVILEVFLIALG